MTAESAIGGPNDARFGGVKATNPGYKTGKCSDNPPAMRHSQRATLLSGSMPLPAWSQCAF